MGNPLLSSIKQTGLWRDLLEVPDAVEATLANEAGFNAAADLLSSRKIHRVVATGNGAALYAAHALYLAAISVPFPMPQVLPVPSGLLASGHFAWQEGDVLLAFSSSGEFRDLVEIIQAGVPWPYIAVTTSPESTVARSAAAVALYPVLNQRAVTHSQVFCASVAIALLLWARLTDDASLMRSLQRAPDALRSQLHNAEVWLDVLSSAPTPRAESAVAFGSGSAWAGALEAALLLKEVAGIPAEGVETRECATSAMYALNDRHLVLSLPTGMPDSRLDEAEAICQARGATVLRAPIKSSLDERLMPIEAFPAAVALSLHLAIRHGFDSDRPSWTDTYYSTARKEPEALNDA